jgi:hypothetical protein
VGCTSGVFKGDGGSDVPTSAGAGKFYNGGGAARNRAVGEAGGLSTEKTKAPLIFVSGAFVFL